MQRYMYILVTLFIILNTQVGACIATSDKQIMAVEYSGEPDGIELEIKRKAEELHPGLDTSNLSSFCK